MGSDWLPGLSSSHDQDAAGRTLVSRPNNDQQDAALMFETGWPHSTMHAKGALCPMHPGLSAQHMMRATSQLGHHHHAPATMMIGYPRSALTRSPHEAIL